MKSGSYGNLTLFHKLPEFLQVQYIQDKKKKKQYNLGKDAFDHLPCVIINGSWMLMLDTKLGDNLQSNTVHKKNNVFALRQSKTTGSEERYLSMSKY